MGPRPDDEALAGAGLRRRGALPHPEEVRDRTALKDVVPARAVEALHRHGAVAVRDLPPAPVLVVPLVFHPIAEVGSRLGRRRKTQDRIGIHGQGPEPAAHLRPSPGQLSTHRVLGQAGRPGRGKELHQRSALVCPSLVVLGGGHVREDRDQVGRSRACRQHLRRPDVGPAEHTDSPVGSLERRRPLDGVEAVARLVAEGIELALRVVSPARVLENDDVPVRREAEHLSPGSFGCTAFAGAAPGIAPPPSGCRRPQGAGRRRAWGP